MLAGDAVLVPHEALSDTPAWLAVPRVRRRFGCGVREAAGLAELFIGLDAGPDVVAWFEGEARRRGVAGVIQDLVHLVAQLAIAEVDGCASLAELAVVGKRLYALALDHDQAGVAWSHFREGVGRTAGGRAAVDGSFPRSDCDSAGVQCSARAHM